MPIDINGFVGTTEATVTVEPGKRFQIRYWNPGEIEIFDQTVPEDETWTIKIQLTVTKTNSA